MSKFTTCYKAMQALLTIKIDNEPDYEAFLHLYFDLSNLGTNKGENMSGTFFDPRKSHHLVKEFEHLLDPEEYKNIVDEFNR